MPLSIIAAVAENGVIGRGGALPWRLSADLRRFRELTTGHAVLMGRRTWESIARQLPDRRMIVITRQPGYRPAEGVETATSLDAALKMASDSGDDEVFIIGGGEIYLQALPQAHRLYLTRIHARVEGDAYFPEYDHFQWRLESAETHAADAKNEHPYTFEVYERVHQ